MAPGTKDVRSRMKKNPKGRDRRVAGFHEVEARNQGTWVDFRKKNEEGEEDDEEEREGAEEEDKEEEEDNPKVYKKVKSTGIYPEGFQRTLNRAVDGEEDKPQLTRKQREELEKEVRRKAYEEKHKRGETEEAKSDLERLRKIRAEREEAKQKRDAEVKAKEEAEKAKQGQDREYIAALGGEKARTGARNAKKKVACEVDQMDAFQDMKDMKKAEKIDPVDAIAGSIDACRLAEDDFM